MNTAIHRPGPARSSSPSILRAAALLAAASLGASAHGQIAPRLLADLNPGFDALVGDSSPTVLAADSFRMLVLASTPATGRDLFLVEERTHTALDVVPGPTGIREIGTAVIAGSGALVLIDDGIHGFEPWHIDLRTKTATRFEIFAGATSSVQAGQGIAVARLFQGTTEFFFRANDGIRGTELHAIDESGQRRRLVFEFFDGPVGTPMTDPVAFGNKLILGIDTADGLGFELGVVHDLEPRRISRIDLLSGSGSSFPANFAVSRSGDVYFAATTLLGLGSELCRYQPANDTARLIADLDPLGASGPNGFLPTPQGHVFFSATIQGTNRLCRVIDDQVDVIDLGNLIGRNGFAHERGFFFVGEEPTHGAELYLLPNNQTPPVLVADLEPGPGSSSPDSFLRLDDDTILFAATRRATVGRELFFSSALRTDLFFDLFPGQQFSDPTDLHLLHGTRIGMVARTSTFGREPCIFDPFEGDLFVHEIAPGGFANPLGYVSDGQRAAADGGFLFVADDGTHGPSLHRATSDPRGFARIDRIGAALSRPRSDEFDLLGARVLFRGEDADGEDDLFATDLSDVENLTDGPNGVEARDPTGLTAVSEVLAMFAADVDVGGQPMGNEPMFTDGTPAGTRIAADLCPGPCSSAPSDFSPLGDGSALFSADDGATGREPWLFRNGAVQQLDDLMPGTAGSNPSRAVGDANGFWFVADGPGIGRELWTSDGTPLGTMPVDDLCPGPCGADVRGLQVLPGAQNGVAFFARGAALGFGLFAAGRLAGSTRLLRSMRTDDACQPGDLVPLGDLLLFVACDDQGVKRLWRTDGTSAGTVVVAPNVVVFDADSLAAVTDTIALFTALVGFERRVFATDGTNVGTTSAFALPPAGTATDFHRSGGAIYYEGSSFPEGTNVWEIRTEALGLAWQDIYGHGCDGSNGRPPRIGHERAPILGRSDFAITCRDAVANRSCALRIGTRVVDVALGTCTVLNDGSFPAIPAGTDSQGRSRIPFSVPNDPALNGFRFQAQWVVLDPNGGSLNGQGAASDGLECQIGRR